MNELNKKKTQSLLLKLIIAFVFIFFGILLFPQKIHNFQNPKICYKNTCFSLEIANTPELRSQGLMFRELLGQNSGMIFVFDNVDFHPFWMKNTIIPLDMIRLDSEFKVVDIINAEPCRQDPCKNYNPKWVAKYVLEINGGQATKIGLKIGDQLKTENFLIY